MSAPTPADRVSAPEHDSVPLARLWLGIAVAPVAWTIAELVSYLVVGLSCEPGRTGIAGLGFASPRIAQAAIVVLTALAAAYGLAVAMRSWRAAHDAVAPDDRQMQRASGSTDPRSHGSAPALGRARFMAVAGMFMSALFLLGIVLFGVPPILVNACSRVH